MIETLKKVFNLIDLIRSINKIDDGFLNKVEFFDYYVIFSFVSRNGSYYVYETINLPTFVIEEPSITEEYLKIDAIRRKKQLEELDFLKQLRSFYKGLPREYIIQYQEIDNLEKEIEELDKKQDKLIKLEFD